jgi:AcrR family transcriptional regulator
MFTNAEQKLYFCFFERNQTMARENKKELLLDAAEKILETQSYEELSLDNIAKVSGFSKGGLLYHFPTKEAVLKALVLRLIQNFDSEFDRQLEKSVTDYKLIFIAANTNPKMISSARGLMAAVSYNKDLIEPLKKAYVRWDKLIFTQFDDPREAWRFRLFFDGLFFCALLDLPQPSKSELKKIVSEFKSKI